jgi:hypothetical protein
MEIPDQVREEQDLEQQAKLNAQPGDRWFKFARLDKYQEVEITRVTQTQIVFSDDERISRATGKVLGHGRFYNVWYRPATAAVRAKIEKDANAKRVSETLQEALTRAQGNSRAIMHFTNLESILTGQ